MSVPAYLRQLRFACLGWTFCRCPQGPTGMACALKNSPGVGILRRDLCGCLM